MTKIRYCICILIACLFIIIFMGTQSNANESVTLHVCGTNDYDKAMQVAEEINNMRVNKGVSPLIISRKLIEDAMTRASELVLLYDHCRPNSTNLTSGLNINQSAHAENISVNDGTLQQLSLEWNASYSHKRNIMSESYLSIGVGCFEYGGDYYWSIIFSSDKFVDECNGSLGRVYKSNSIEILQKYLNFQTVIVGNYYNSNFSLNKNHRINLIYRNPKYSKAKLIIKDEDYSLSSKNENIAIIEDHTFKLVNEGNTDIIINCGRYQLEYNVTGNTLIPESIEEYDLTNDLKYNTDTTLKYATHVENYGDSLGYSNEGIMSGTQGQALRMESITIELDSSLAGDIEYRTHVEDYGWMEYVPNGYMSGTEGEAKRLEAIQIRLTGELEEKFDIYYCVHVQNYGWLNWAKNGEMAGTSGQGLRVEGIIIVLIEKDKLAPNPIDNQNIKSYYFSQLNYQSHVENIGWQDYVYENQISGTSGQALRVEAIRISPINQLYSGDIEYITHVENIGWLDHYSKNGELSGTEGQALRIEAIKIKLTGEMAEHYDIYYTVHVENYGWLGWAKNGDPAGTVGKALRVEAIKIILLEKGSEVPDEMQVDNCFI